MGSAWSASSPEVLTKGGKLRGRVNITAAGTKYFAFLGVPYAKPPVGELRFKAPVPAEPWSGVRDAVVEGNPCQQNFPAQVPGVSITAKAVYGFLKVLPAILHRFNVYKRQSEDCLYLNVYIPASAMPSREAGQEAALRPVLFWIHGGGFQMCDANQDLLNPDLFLDKNIVVVTPNYRLGPLGFLSVGTADAPGNAGLKDQTMALRWTHDNIRAFGGDPDAITVYGESAGGASAHFHHISPLSRGLFRGVIASSGSALDPWATTKRSLDVARALAKELGLQADTPAEVTKALRAVSTASLLKAAKTMPKICDSICDDLMFLPVVEPADPTAFISVDPVDMVRAGNYSEAPLLTGVCSAEGLVWFMFTLAADEEAAMARINNLPLLLVPPGLRELMTPEELEQCNKDILNEYTGGKPFSRETLPDLIQMYGDMMFMMRQPTLARLYAEQGRTVYTYRFDFEGQLNFLKNGLKARMKGLRPVEGTSHGDELAYLAMIRLIPLPHLADDSREMICRKRLIQLWVNFIETGDPTPPARDETLLPVQWTACTKESQPYLSINDTLELKTDKLYPHQDFWDNLHQKYWGKAAGLKA